MNPMIPVLASMASCPLREAKQNSYHRTRLGKPGGKGFFRAPAQFALKPAGVDRIAMIMARTLLLSILVTRRSRILAPIM
jgi:hypothetical protein